MFAFLLYGLNMPTASFFQAIGSPIKSLAIPLVRQGLFLIPLSLLLGSALGFNGVLLAAPIADLASFILSVTLVIFEFRHWNKKEWI